MATKTLCLMHDPLSLFLTIGITFNISSCTAKMKSEINPILVLKVLAQSNFLLFFHTKVIDEIFENGSLFDKEGLLTFVIEVEI